MTKQTVQVYFNDCQGRLADGEIVDRVEWSNWAVRRQAIDPERRAVVRVDGIEHIVVPVIEATRVYWKAI